METEHEELLKKIGTARAELKKAAGVAEKACESAKEAKAAYKRALADLVLLTDEVDAPTLPFKDGEPDGETLADVFNAAEILAAGRIAIGMGRCSIATLQRKLTLGYARASRLMNELDARGLLGDLVAAGSLHRKVIMTLEQWEAAFAQDTKPQEQPPAPSPEQINPTLEIPARVMELLSRPPLEDESWKGVYLARIGLPDHIVKKLAENDPAILTIGDVAKYTDKRELVGVRGIGIGAAERISRAIDAYFAQHPQLKQVDGVQEWHGELLSSLGTDKVSPVAIPTEVLRTLHRANIYTLGGLAGFCLTRKLESIEGLDAAAIQAIKTAFGEWWNLHQPGTPDKPAETKPAEPETKPGAGETQTPPGETTPPPEQGAEGN